MRSPRPSTKTTVATEATVAITTNPTSFNTGIAERFQQEPTKQIVTDMPKHGRSGTQTAENDGSDERAPSSTQVDRVDHR